MAEVSQDETLLNEGNDGKGIQTDMVIGFSKPHTPLVKIHSYVQG